MKAHQAVVTPFLSYGAALWHHVPGRGTLVSMPPVRPRGRRANAAPPPSVIPSLHALLNAGTVTPGLAVTARGGHFILARTDHLGADPRFRLTPLSPTTYGLSLYRRNRWEPLPYQGSFHELVDVMNTDLAHWATDWLAPSERSQDL